MHYPPSSTLRRLCLPAAAALLLGCLASACTPAATSPAVQPEPSPPEPAAATTASADRQWGPVQVVIYKAKRRLLVYRHGQFYKQYPIVLGFKPAGRKRYADDARTPEGYYHIIDIRPHERWSYFITFDYPNARDRRLYAKELAAGTIPTFSGKPLGIGGGVGIHGSDKPELQARGEDWTKGCIAMDSQDVTELQSLVTVGTPLWVLE